MIKRSLLCSFFLFFLFAGLFESGFAIGQEMGASSPSAPAPVTGDADHPDSSLPLQDSMKHIAAVEEDAPEKEILKRAAEDIRAELARIENEKIYVPSLFFSEKEQKVLDEVLRRSGSQSANMAREALEGVGTVSDEILAKLQEEDRLREMQRRAEERSQKRIPQILILGGIMYKTDQDWTVWLNNRPVTPRSKPNEITSIRVTKEFVELKWKDPLTDRIYPVRMRPNQGYDMETGTFFQGGRQ